MKTTDLMTMAMAVLLASCSQNEITVESPDVRPALGFGVYATPQTRGTITDNNASGTGIKAKGFGVLAYYTGQNAWNNMGAYTSNFMYNQEVKHTSSAWGYAPQKYWPNTEGDKISFFAYAPYSASSGTNGITLSTNAATGAPTLNFVLQTTPAALVDLVATNATDAEQTTGTNQTINVTKRTSTVQFKFNHVLTRAGFLGKLDAAPNAETHIFVTGLKLLKSAAPNSAKFYASATYQWKDGTWNYGTATKQSSDYDLLSIMPRTTPSSMGGYTTSGIELTATAKSLFNTGEYLFLIPPADITGITAGDISVQVDYDIVTVDNKLSAGHSKTSTTAVIPLPAGTMKRGSAYDYTFTIGLEKVQVSADVLEWGNGAAGGSDDDRNVVATAAGVSTAITNLNNIKNGLSQNQNYFVLKIQGSATVSSSSPWALTGATNYFKSGDQIELNFGLGTTTVNSAYITLSGWQVESKTLTSSGSIVLTKN